MKQKTIQEQYILLKEGKINPIDFLKKAKREFPSLITSNSSLNDTETVLKTNHLINENYMDLKPMMVGESKPKESWETSFQNFLKEAKDEEVKSDTDKVSKYVEDSYKKNYGGGEKNHPNKISFQQYLNGVYFESYNEKNEGKTLEEVITIVNKNLEKDFQYYLKNQYKGIEGIGLTSMDEPKEPKGKHASSGYGDLDKDTKSLIKEDLGLNKGLMSMIKEGLGDGDVKRKTYELDITSIESFKKMLAQYFPDKFKYDLDYYIDWFNREIRPNLNEDNDEEDGSFVDDKLLRDIDNKVKLINSLIEKAFDEDGDPIPVVDTTGTWESPTVYSPIHFDGTNLTIVSKEVYGGKEEIDEYEGENLYYDGIPSLNYIGRMYRKVLKKHDIQENIAWDDSEYDEYKKQESGLIVKVDSQDINSFENWLDQSAFYAEEIEDGVYLFPEDPANFDNLEKFIQIEMAAEDISVQFEGQEDNLNEAERFIPHAQLHENQNMNLQQKLKEIERGGVVASLESKINAIQEEIDSRQEKITSISENEALSEFVDKNQIKGIEKEIKELEKHKAKLEKTLDKANGGKKPKKQVVDEDDDVNDDESVEESYYEYDDERYWEEKDDEAYAAAYDAMDDETLETDDDLWADDNKYLGGEHDFKNHPIQEGYSVNDKIDFLSGIRYPEQQDMLEFGNLDRLSPKTIQTLFESYFPHLNNKKIIKG